MEFPRLVYKSASVHTVAEDKIDFDILMKEGWYSSVPEAIKGKHEEPEKDASQKTDSEPQPTREELEQKAEELGIGFNSRTSDETLLERIEALLSDAEE